MKVKSIITKFNILNFFLCFLILKNSAEGFDISKEVKRKFDPDKVEKVFRIADEIGLYAESIPNMFRVLKKELTNLEREVKLNAMFPAENDMEAFRVIVKPLNKFLKNDPKDFFVRNPPRGTAYKVQLKEAREAVKGVYRELQMLWLSDI